MLLRTLVVVSCLAAPALAQPADCDALRRVLAIAAKYNMDTGDLVHLEPQLCARPVSRVACQQLDAFWMLALALEQPKETLTALEAQRAVWCAREDEPPRALQWPDGTQLRSTSGILSWPSGSMARSSSGSWSAPNGAMVRSSGGGLSYPTGALARSSSGRWSLADGQLADEGQLAALACASDTQWCRFFLGELNQSTGLRRDFAMLGLGMLAARPRDERQPAPR